MLPQNQRRRTRFSRWPGHGCASRRPQHPACPANQPDAGARQSARRKKPTGSGLSGPVISARCRPSSPHRSPARCHPDDSHSEAEGSAVAFLPPQRLKPGSRRTAHTLHRCRVPHPCRLALFGATGWEAPNLNGPVLYQGTTSVKIIHFTKGVLNEFNIT